MTPHPMSAPWRAAFHLAQREIIRFLRQRNRVIGALGQPILFWLLFGVGLGQTFRMSSTGQSGESFLSYFLPGTLVLILLFTAIFATISIIEDRREGFLQGVLVAPVPRWSIVLGKVGGGATIAFAQALFFVTLVWLSQLARNEVGLGGPGPGGLGLVRLALLAGWLFLSATALTSLGFLLAWRMESTQGFHAIMNLLLMPMWLLSGAFWPIPAGGNAVDVGLHWTMRLNPVTYCVAGVRHFVYDSTLPAEFYLPSIVTCWAVMIVFTAVVFAAACQIAAQRVSGDLQ